MARSCFYHYVNKTVKNVITMTIDFREPPYFYLKIGYSRVFTSKTDGKHRMPRIVTRHHKIMLWVNGVKAIQVVGIIFV